MHLRLKANNLKLIKMSVWGMASLLLHGLFIYGVAYFAFPHLPEKENTLEIIWVEPRPASPEKAAEPISAKAEPIIAEAKFPKAIVPAAVAPAAMVSSLNQVQPAAKIGTIFLLDASESMVVGLEQGRQVLKDRIEGLPEKTLVNIAYFSRGVVFFSPELFILAKKEKENALVFCQEIKAQGSLEIADGLRETLKRNPSKVILISDGLAEDREATYKIIREARREGVIIDTILIQRTPFEDEVLKRAGYLTGGSFSVSPRTF